MSNSKIILVAAHQLRGGKVKGDTAERAVVEPGEELTAAKRKALGLDDDAVQALVDRGAVVEVNARLAESGGKGDDAAVRAAEARADEAEKRAGAAEQKAAELEDKVKALEAQLEEARKLAKPAQG